MSSDIAIRVDELARKICEDLDISFAVPSPQWKRIIR